MPVSRTDLTDLTEEGACAGAGAGAGADRGETANLSPKIATGTATATLGSNHEVDSEPHRPRLSPLPWFELTLSPISLVRLLPTHSVRLVVAFARSGDAEGNTIMSEEPSPTLRTLCGARTMLQRASLQSPVPNRVVFAVPTSHTEVVGTRELVATGGTQSPPRRALLTASSNLRRSQRQRMSNSEPVFISPDYELTSP